MFFFVIQMLKVKLQKPEKRGQNYEVFFDSSARFKFTNLRRANDFLTSVSKRCTDALIFVNSEYAYLHQKYREFYFFFDSWEEHIQIESSLDFIKNKISFFLFHQSGINYNYMLITGIERCLEELCSVYMQLTPVEISRRSAPISHLHRVKRNTLQLFLSEFVKFEKELIKEEKKLKMKVVQLRKIS
jgi:hypothetical protein